MKDILVLTDFSDRAKCAAEYAMNLAIHLKANLILCHALEITEQLTYPLADHLILRNQTMKRLREVGMHLNELAVPGNPSGNFRPSMTYINDLDMLAEVADKLVDNNHVDLVVIGSHKSNGLSHFFSGSHTNDVLDHIKCPVLMVPENTVFNPLKNIAYATDLTFNNTKVISYLAQLAQPFSAEISVDHISPLELPLSTAELEVEQSIIDQMVESNVELSYKTIKGDSVIKGLLEISDSEKVDILALVHKRYDFFEGLFHSSISKQLAHSTKVPLLVMPFSFSLNDEDLVNN